jgi:hypothetical protein
MTAVAAVAAADDALAAAVDDAVGALVADKDVVDVAAVEGGLVEVVRRGKRERLQTLLEGPLFALVRERMGEPARTTSWRLKQRAMLTALPLVDGRVALRVQKAPPSDAQLAHLVEEGVVPGGVDGEFVAAVLEGGGVAFVGPARAAHRRVAVAVARALSPLVRVACLSDDPIAGCLPPVDVGGDVGGAGAGAVARARAAVAAGADVVVALGVDVDDAVALCDAALPVPVIASIDVASVAALEARFGARKTRALFAIVAVVGFAPDGRPRLVELHGGVADAAPVPVTAPTSTSTAPMTMTAPATASMQPTSLQPATSTSTAATRPPPAALLGEVPALGDAPPADWASDNVDDDPGWELGSLADPQKPAAPGSFEAALQQQAKRPVFTPRPPPVHPQTASLKGTGGLTFEPPGLGGAPGPDDDGDGSPE